MAEDRSRRRFDKRLDQVLEEDRGRVTPTRLFHFTRIGTETEPSGFEGIVQQQRIRATRHADLEDETELKMADSFVTRVAHELSRGAKRATRLAVAKFINDYSEEKLERTVPVYIACFSASGDSPRNWQEFGAEGRGVALCFRYLPEETKLAPPKVHEGFFPVEYDLERAENRFRIACQKIFHHHDAFLSSHRGPSDGIGMVWSALFRLAATSAVRTKARRYEPEAEWRLFGMLDPVDVKETEIQGTRWNGARWRYIEMPLRDGPPLLDSIVIGCHRPFEETKRYCCEVLRRHGWPVPDDIRPGPRHESSALGGERAAPGAFELPDELEG
jgi:hypothetical protein